MNNAHWPDPYFPVSDVSEEVLVRLPELPEAVFQHDLVLHVAGRIRNREDFNAFQPSFFRMHIEPKLTAAAGVRSARGKAQEAMLYELEMALACCEFAKAPEPKPLREVLERALVHCSRFDELRAEERCLETKRSEDRQRGGKARQAKLECVRLRAARLIRAHAPVGGWCTEAEAARAIEARLIVFIKSRRLSLVCESNLRRTIVRWIRHHPIVRAAYGKHRRPPRT